MRSDLLARATRLHLQPDAAVTAAVDLCRAISCFCNRAQGGGVVIMEDAHDVPMLWVPELDMTEFFHSAETLAS